MNGPPRGGRPVRRRCLPLLLAGLGVACTGDPQTDLQGAERAAEAARPSTGDPSTGTLTSPGGGLPFPGLAFTDVTESAGITFVHDNDASPARWLPETMGPGAAFFDQDRDGLPDLFLVNGASLRGARPTRSRGGGRLYRNLGGGRFEDRTANSGLDVPMYGMGAAVADVDQDGWIDLLVTALDAPHLFRNRGDGSFEDVSGAFGLPRDGFGTSAAFLDYDRDGDLDLFVCRYVAWSPETDLECRPDGVHRVYCTPELYPPVPSLLLRNEDGARFTDVSADAGITAYPGKALGVVVFDHDRDGWPDLAVANDTVRNFVFLNGRDGTFTEIAIEAGFAFSESGAARGGMGIDSADFDRDGASDLVVGNFSYEMTGLYRARGPGLYLDEAAQLGLGFATLTSLTFGVLAEDLNRDGWCDLVLANGHIEPEIDRVHRTQHYAQRPQVFVGVAGQRFEPLPAEGALERALVGRGLAAADIDLDGDLDLLFTQNGREARLYRNDATGRSWIGLRLIDARGSATPFGARVRVHCDSAGAGAGRTVLERTLTGGRSYLSASNPALLLGLGGASTIDTLYVRWPSGREQRWEKPELGKWHTLVESSLAAR